MRIRFSMHGCSFNNARPRRSTTCISVLAGLPYSPDYYHSQHSLTHCDLHSHPIQLRIPTAPSLSATKYEPPFVKGPLPFLGYASLRARIFKEPTTILSCFAKEIWTDLHSLHQLFTIPIEPIGIVYRPSYLYCMGGEWSLLPRRPSSISSGYWCNA
ncbi:hypothetical protein V1524DRAFT_439039 [Lipomyces starkeyi]